MVLRKFDAEDFTFHIYDWAQQKGVKCPDNISELMSFLKHFIF